MDTLQYQQRPNLPLSCAWRECALLLIGLNIIVRLILFHSLCFPVFGARAVQEALAFFLFLSKPHTAWKASRPLGDTKFDRALDYYR